MKDGWTREEKQIRDALTARYWRSCREGDATGAAAASQAADFLAIIVSLGQHVATCRGVLEKGAKNDVAPEQEIEDTLRTMLQLSRGGLSDDKKALMDGAIDLVLAVARRGLMPVHKAQEGKPS